MQSPPIPENEAARLAALRTYELLDTEAEQAFDDLTAVAAHVMGTPIALVSLVDGERQFFKSKVGLDATETPRDVSFCAHAILKPDQVMVVPDATADARFADNPLVTGELGIRFYAGTPLVDDDGHALGSLCTIDDKPREITPEQVDMLQRLGRLAMSRINARLREREMIRSGGEHEWANALLRSQQEASPDGILIVDENQQVISMNQRFVEVWDLQGLGAVNEPPFTDEFLKFIVERRVADPAGFLGRVGELYADREATSRDEIRLKDGRVLERYSGPVRLAGGEFVGRVWYFRDVTEQRRMTQALRDGEERFARIAANVPGLIYRCESSAGGPARFTYVSDGCRDLFGIEPAAVLADAAQLNGRIHPADVPSLIAETDRAAAAGTPLNWTGRHLMSVVPGDDTCPIDAGENVKWINVVGRPIPDGCGGVVTDGVVYDVTEQRRTQEALRQSDERFSRIISSVPGMVYQYALRPDGTLLVPFVSGGFRDIYGLDPERLYERPEILHEGVHPEDAAGFHESVAQSYKTLRPWHWEGRIKRADGQTRWIKGQSRPEREADGTVVWNGVVVDITAAKEVERDLRRLSLVAASADSAAIVADPHGHIEWVNPAFERLTGHAAADVIGKKPGRLLQGADTDPATVAHMRDCIARGEGFAVEVVNYHRDGRPYWLDLEVRPVRDPMTGALTNFIAIERDITAAKETDQRLRAAIVEADRANAAKSDFLANMSHEIRTPLGAVIGFGDLLLEDLSRPTPAEEGGEGDAAADVRRGWTETIRGSAKHLLALINDVLDLSKIESGKMEFEEMDCSPHDLLGEVVSIMRVPAAKKKLSLSLQYLTPIPASIRSDPTRLKQVVFNLVNNAVKFTESGGVRLLVSCDQTGGEPRLTVHVNDTGVGIPADKLGKLFAPFTQADTSVTRKFGGTGLGLCISRHICRGLGGDVTVATQEGIGSTFTVKINTGDLDGVRMLPRETGEALHHDEPPARRRSDPPRPAAARAPAAAIARRVLVADDGETNRQLIDLLLRRAGVEVAQAVNGAEALRMLRDGLDVDLVLMDMQMPVMDGYTAVAQLRESGSTLPVIALTAHAMSGDRDRCLSSGCDDYLTKPIDRNKLLAAVAKWARKGDEAERLVADDTAPLVSSLPMDDADFVEIAADFVRRAEERLPEFDAATREGDAAELKSLAHWLRGVGGSAGYAKIAERAGAIEQLAPKLADDESAEAIAREVAAVRTLLARAAAALPTPLLAA